MSSQFQTATMLCSSSRIGNSEREETDFMWFGRKKISISTIILLSENLVTRKHIFTPGF